MYKIIGADGREYGPVTAEQLRQWIADGRVTADTRVLAEGGTEWRPLWMFTGFVTTPPPPAPAPPPVPPVQSSVQAKPPGADKKIAAGLCGVLLGGMGIHKFILGYTTEGVTMLAVTLCCVPLGIITCGIGFLAIPAMHVIGLVEGIIYLTKSDEDFSKTYITNKKGWF